MHELDERRAHQLARVPRGQRHPVDKVIDRERDVSGQFPQQAKLGVPACMACHGPDGRGNPGAGYVRIALVPSYAECVEAARRIVEFCC